MCFGSAPKADTRVQDEYARITRQVYDNARATFGGLESKLLNIVNDENYVEDAASRAGELSERSFDRAQGVGDRQLGRYGVTLTGDQAATRDRLQRMDRNLSRVGNKNRARIAATDRQTALRGDLMSIGNGILSGAMGNFGAAAGAENQRNAFNRQQHANDFAAVGKALGSATAFAFMGG